MKNTIKIISIIAFIGIVMSSCDLFQEDEDTPSIIGTWKGGSEQVVFKDDNTFTYFISGKGNISGNFTYDNTSVQMTMTHYYSGSWVERTASETSDAVWKTFDGRSRTYSIKKWESNDKYYISISDIQAWGKYLTRQ